MSALEVITYVADFLILGTYALTKRGKSILWFDLANAIGCVPLLWIEIITGAYPVIPLTGTFGALGVVGVIQHRRERRKPKCRGWAESDLEHLAHG